MVISLYGMYSYMILEKHCSTRTYISRFSSPAGPHRITAFPEFLYTSVRQQSLDVLSQIETQGLDSLPRSNKHISTACFHGDVTTKVDMCREEVFESLALLEILEMLNGECENQRSQWIFG